MKHTLPSDRHIDALGVINHFFVFSTWFQDSSNLLINYEDQKICASTPLSSYLPFYHSKNAFIYTSITTPPYHSNNAIIYTPIIPPYHSKNAYIFTPIMLCAAYSCIYSILTKNTLHFPSRLKDCVIPPPLTSVCPMWNERESNIIKLMAILLTLKFIWLQLHSKSDHWWLFLYIIYRNGNLNQNPESAGFFINYQESEISYSDSDSNFFLT